MSTLTTFGSVSARFLVAIVLLAACKSSAPADAGPVDAAPKLALVAGATKLVLRDVSSSHGSEHDVVVELTRDGTEVTWVAKLTDRGYALGDPAPDPTLLMNDEKPASCVCPVRDVCTCESPRGGETIRKSGKIPVDAFDAFLVQVGKAESAAPIAGDTTDGRVHVALTVPGAAAPVHLSRGNEAASWTLDGIAIDHKAMIDAAWTRLLDAIGERAWIAALHPLPPMVNPHGWADLAKADAIEIEDDGKIGATSWSVQLRLERKGAAFAWRGKFSTKPNALGTSVIDRYAQHRTPVCFCSVDATCPCEAEQAPERKAGTVPAAVVEAFLGDLAKRSLGSYELGGWPSPWTEDSPEGHVIVWLAGESAPLHLAYLDPKESWGVNGRALDEGKGTKPGAYAALLGSLGASGWRTGNRTH